jgi:hypothetical protein
MVLLLFEYPPDDRWHDDQLQWPPKMFTFESLEPAGILPYIAKGTEWM